MPPLRCMLSVLFIFFAQNAVRAADWPKWMGPGRTAAGAAPDILDLRGGAMIYLSPMAFACITVGLFCIYGSAALSWKAVAFGLLAASLIFQFYPPFPVHWVVPTLTQSFLGIWMIIYWRTDW